MYHSFFIHSYVGGHVRCFRVLAIVNSVAVNTGMHVSFQIISFTGCTSKSGITGSQGSCIYIFFKGTFILFCIGSMPVYMPINSVGEQFSSVAQSCLTLCNPMDFCMLDFPVHHQLLELAQIHVHRVGDLIQPSHPLVSPSPLAFNLSQVRVVSNESLLPIK